MPSAETGPRGVHIRRRGVEEHGATLPINEKHGAIADVIERSWDTHDGGNAQGVGEDRRVGRPSSLFGHEADHMLPVELHRDTRRQLAGNHDHRLIELDRPFLVIGSIQQPVQDLSLHGGEIGQAFPQARRPSPGFAELQGLEFECRLGAQEVVANEHLDTAEIVFILHHEDLGVATRSRSVVSP